MDGRVATWISQSRDSTMPTTTPRSTPTDSTPMTAATAIQKSNRFTRRSRRNSATSIIPNTTASMMIAARTALGSSEKSGASRISVARTIPPVASEATGVRAPADSFSELAERLVETGMPWNTPAPRLAIPWATDSWLRSMRYRCLVANAWASPAVWENPMSSSAKAAMTMAGRFCDTSSSDGTCGSGRPRGTGPTSATPCAPRSNRTEPTRPPTTRTSAPGILGSANRSPRMTARATSPTSSVAGLRSPRPRTHDANSCQAFTPSAEVPVSLGSSPMTTSMAAPARNPVTTARERKLASQPSLRMATSRNRAPVAIAIAATSCAASLPLEAGHQDRAAGDGRERRAWAGRDVSRRAEQAVDDRGRGGGVEPVLHRDAGDACVAEVLGHDHRGDRDARDQVAAEPLAVVRPRPVEDRDESRQSRCGGGRRFSAHRRKSPTSATRRNDGPIRMPVSRAFGAVRCALDPTDPVAGWREPDDAQSRMSRPASRGARVTGAAGSQVPATTPTDRRLPILLAMAMFVLVVDTSIMNVSISAVVADLGTTVSAIQSAIALEALVSAAFILIGSKIGDLYGRKRAYVLGLHRVCHRCPGDGPGPERDRDLHLLGDDRWARRVIAVAGDAVVDPRQLRRRRPEGDLRPGGGRGGDRRGDRTAHRRLHHDLPVLPRGVPARGRRHRDRPAGQPARARRAVHGSTRDRPRRCRPLGPGHGRPRAGHPRVAGGWRGRRPAPGDRRDLARRARLLAGAPEARRQADADRSRPVQVDAVQVGDLRADAPEHRARWRDDHHPDLPADGPRVQRPAGGPVHGAALAQHVRGRDPRRQAVRVAAAQQHHPGRIRRSC